MTQVRLLIDRRAQWHEPLQVAILAVVILVVRILHVMAEFSKSQVRLINDRWAQWREPLQDAVLTALFLRVRMSQLIAKRA